MPKRATASKPAVRRRRPPINVTIAAEVEAALRARCERTGERQCVIVEAALRAFLRMPPPAPAAPPPLPEPGA